MCKFCCNFAAFFNSNTMRKIILLAFMALGMSAFAQKVTPLNIQLAEVKLDSLRNLYIAEPTMYRASLEVLAQELTKNGEDVKAARAELKDEIAHSKEMSNSIDDASKMAASLKKIYAKEESTLKSMQKTVEKQQRKLNSNKRLNKEARDSYSTMLEKQQKELGYALRELAERQRAIAELETSIQNWQTTLQSYVQETQQKALELTKIESTLKERTDAVKAEQKFAKTL